MDSNLSILRNHRDLDFMERGRSCTYPLASADSPVATELRVARYLGKSEVLELFDMVRHSQGPLIDLIYPECRSRITVLCEGRLNDAMQPQC